MQLNDYDTDETPRQLQALARAARPLPRRAHLREGVRQRPADLGADFRCASSATTSMSSSSLAHEVEDLVEGHARHARCQESAERVAHQPQAAHRFAEGAAARRADRRARSRGAPVGAGRSGRHVQGNRAASSTPSWCARPSTQQADSAALEPGARARARRRDAAAVAARYAWSSRTRRR